MQLCQISLLFVIYLLSEVVSQMDQRKARPVLVFDAPEIDSYLSNERLINLQIKCLLSGGACDSLGRFIKVRLSKSFLGECESCTKQQSENMKKFLGFLKTKYPDTYASLIRKYYPIVPIDMDFGLKQNNREVNSHISLVNYNDTLANQILVEMDHANNLNSYISKSMIFKIPIISSK